MDSALLLLLFLTKHLFKDCGKQGRWQPILDLLLDSKILLLVKWKASFVSLPTPRYSIFIFCLYPTSQNIQAMLLRKITGPALATKFLSVPPKENLMDHQCVCVSECVCVCVCVRTCAHVSHSSVSDSLWSHDCSPPGSSIQGILPARTLERVAISFSRESSWPRDRTQISCIACRLFII